MSTMLATTNPEVVAEIDPARDRRRPYVGQWVVFHARTGEGRQGKLSAPALVIGVEDEDHVEVLITYAADDSLVRWKIPRKSDQNPTNSWSFNEYDEEHYQPGKVELPAKAGSGRMSWADIEQMYVEVGELRARVAELEGKTIVPAQVVLPKVHKAK